MRLQQGDYNRETVFGADPAAMAQQWVSQGARFLHLVDLDGAREGTPQNLPSIEAIVDAVDVPVQLGGGIRDEVTIDHLLKLGVSRVVIGTQALKQPDWFREMRGKFPGKLVLGIDARDGRVATHGWLETSEVLATELAREMCADDAGPLAALVVTDIATDGMLAGPNFSALSEMRSAVEVSLIASGGVTTADDVARLTELGMDGCIIGRSLYEGKLTLPAALAAAGTA